MRRLDQQGSGVDVASLGDSTNAATLAGGVCRRMVRCGASGTGDGSLTALSRPMEAAPISGALLDHVAALADPRLHAKVLFPLPEILLPGFSRRHCRGGRFRRGDAGGNRASGIPQTLLPLRRRHLEPR